jgi:hypothetical protein
VGLAQWRSTRGPSGQIPGSNPMGSITLICTSFWLVPSQFWVGFSRWLRSHHGHALLPNVQVGAFLQSVTVVAPRSNAAILIASNDSAALCFVFQSPDNPLDKGQAKGEGAEAGKGFPLPVLLCPPGHQRIWRRGVYIVLVRGLSPRRRDTKCKRRCRDDNPERVAW